MCSEQEETTTARRQQTDCNSFPCFFFLVFFLFFFFVICYCSMADQRLVLEAVSALLGCRVEARSSSGSAPYMLTPQDLVNIVSLKEFYKQEGLQELDYPSIGTISLRDQDQDQDLYSSPPALTEGPSKEVEEEKEDTRTLVTIDPEDFFDRSYDYDFTHIKVSESSCITGHGGDSTRNGLHLNTESQPK